MTAPMNALYERLVEQTPESWQRAVETLASQVHPIDREATRIWFAFFPLELHLILEAADDQEAVARKLGLMGKWRLADQIGTSHRFLFAHRYWPQVKSAVQAVDAQVPDDIVAAVTAVADAAARTARVDREMLLGITAVALMTLRQVGPDAFAAEPPTVHLSEKARAMSAHQVLKARARDDWQGVFGFARGMRKQWTVTFDESDPEARFTVINGQEIATAAQTDKRPHHVRDARCTPGEGPIPVECRAASCGTCWVGVLGGADKLSVVNERDERRRMRVFGYTDSGEERPLIRLACQAQAFGAVSIVIPPWNGVFASGLKRS
jgi:ferredoxin